MKVRNCYDGNDVCNCSRRPTLRTMTDKHCIENIRYDANGKPFTAYSTPHHSPEPPPPDYTADGLMDISGDETLITMMLRHLQIIVEGTREKHFRIHDDSTPRYTGPLCTEQEPCQRCGGGEKDDDDDDN